MTKQASGHVLPHLLRDAFGSTWLAPSTQDIFVNREGEFLERNRYGMGAVSAPALSARLVRSIATHAAQLRGQRFDEASPLLDAELPNGDRLAAVMHPCTPMDCPLLAIRRGSAELPTLESLGAGGLFDLFKDKSYEAQSWRQIVRVRMERQRANGALFELLCTAIENDLTVAFVGPTGSGKTHDMKALLMKMRQDRRTLFVGDVNEIPSTLPLRNFGVMLAGTHGDIAQSSLIAQSLRMAPELLCVLETRNGDAAWALFRALASGHQGMTSWHAPSASQAFTALAAMMRESPNAQGMSSADIIERLRMMFHIIASVARMPDGGFRITELLFGDEIS